MNQYQLRSSDDRRSVDSVRVQESVRPSDDKLTALKNYRRAKGLCFTCGERWGREHKCQPTVQLHVVQEMVEFFQSNDDSAPPSPSVASDDMELNLMSVDSTHDSAPEHSIILNCSVQGKAVVFLLDSGSNNSFLSVYLAE